VTDRLTMALADRYSIERELGAGGMATVYLARDLKHDRKVALKVLKPELAAVVGAERFLAEIRTTASLQHPNILPLFDSGTADSFLFYVMPYVEGESLEGRLSRERQLPVEEAIAIAKSLAEALDYAHRKGVIHRDIKPANVLLLDGKPALADFGIALAVGAAGGGRLTETGLSLGTPNYMSPEQATGDANVGPAADVYALGCLLYEMLAGEPPHGGPNAQAVLAKVLTESAAPVSQYRKSVPANVDATVAKALEKVPADRFRSAAAFCAALGDSSFRHGEAKADTDPRRGRRSWASYAPWVISAAAILAAIVIALQTASAGPAQTMMMSDLLPPEGYDFSEAESFGAFSPDGSRFAFITLGPFGETELWIRHIDGSVVQRIEGTSGALAPFWSPDGSRLGYLKDQSVWTADPSGGSAVRVCAVEGATGGSWGSAGLIAVTAAAGVFAVEVSAAECRLALATPSDVFEARHPAILPDGKRVLVTWFGGDRNIALVDLESGDQRILIPNVGDPTLLAGHIVFSRGSREGGTQLVAQGFDAGSLELSGEAVVISKFVRTMNGIAAYAVSSGGTLMYLSGLGDRGQLATDRSGVVLDSVLSDGSWTFAVARSHPWVAEANGVVGGIQTIGITDVSRHTQRTVVEGGGRFQPLWSPGDSLLAYTSCAGVHCSLAIASVSGARDTLYAPVDTSAAYNYWASSWTDDDRIVFTRTLQYSMESAQIWQLDLKTGAMSVVLPRAMEGVVSPDAKWLAYQSHETGTWQVYVRSFDAPGDVIPVSMAGGRSPRWGADGSELVFVAPTGMVMSARVSGRAPIGLDVPRPIFQAPGWSRHNFHDIPAPFDMSADGQLFGFRLTPTGTTAVVVQNWLGALGRGLE
jgi:eukaryotic-like serine/threonine-protein kinase